MYLIILFISAVRTVSRGHKLVAEGWHLFEKTCSEVGVGELPQLLRYVKQATTPTPTPTGTPVKFEEEEDVSMEPSTSEGKIFDKPIHVTEGGKTLYYRCPNCDITPKKSRMGMDSHIRSVHTKKPLLCSFCAFTSYNMDSMTRHEKEHK